MKFLENFRKFSKKIFSKLLKIIIIGYCSKNLTNPKLITIYYKLFVKFDKLFMKTIEKLNFYYEKFVSKNRVFGTNTIVLH